MVLIGVWSHQRAWEYIMQNKCWGVWFVKKVNTTCWILGVDITGAQTEDNSICFQNKQCKKHWLITKIWKCKVCDSNKKSFKTILDN